jgi:signal peptidase II
VLRYLSFLALPLYVLDQVTKGWVVRRFAAPTEFGYEEVEVIPGFFWVHRLHNTGVAFGRFNGGEYSNLIFGSVSVIALAVILIMWWKSAFPTRTSRTAATLLVAGILGNLTDRLVRGYVVDFLKFDLQFMVWPSFNVADSCICVAAALLVITAWQKPEKVPAPTAAAE